MTELEITGLKELIKSLSEVLPKKIRAATKRGMETSVKNVQRWARGNAPVDTGLLRSSIATEVHSTFGEVRGVIGSPVRYAAKVEEPGPVRNPRHGRRPWLRPAISEHEKEIEANFTKELNKVFKEEGFT